MYHIAIAVQVDRILKKKKEKKVQVDKSMILAPFVVPCFLSPLISQVFTHQPNQKKKKKSTQYEQYYLSAKSIKLKKKMIYCLMQPFVGFNGRI